MIERRIIEKEDKNNLSYNPDYLNNTPGLNKLK